MQGALVKVAAAYEGNNEWPSLQHFVGKQGRLVRPIAGGWGWTAMFGDLEGTFRTRDGVHMLAYVRGGSSSVSRHSGAADLAIDPMRINRPTLREAERSPRKTPRARLADDAPPVESARVAGGWADDVPVFATGERIPSPALVLPKGAPPVQTLRGGTPRNDAPSDVPRGRPRPGASRAANAEHGWSAPAPQRTGSGGSSGSVPAAPFIAEGGGSGAANPFALGATGEGVSVARLMHETLAGSIAGTEPRPRDPLAPRRSAPHLDQCVRCTCDMGGLAGG